MSDRIKIKIQIICGDEIAMGPGKADLLDAIAREGSISAAGRALGMSYRRTWMLVDTMNRCWRAPLVETAAGGSHGGGARVTELGRRVAERYRTLCHQAEAVAAGQKFKDLLADLLKEPKERKDPSGA